MSAKRVSRKPRVGAATAGPETRFLEPLTVEDVERLTRLKIVRGDFRYFLTYPDRAEIDDLLHAHSGQDSLGAILRVAEKRIDTIWNDISTNSEFELNDADKGALKSILDEFLEQEEFESNAPFRDDVMQQIRIYKEGAANFLKALVGTENKIDREAALQARLCIRQELVDLNAKENVSFDHLIRMTTDFLSACDLASRDLKSGSGFHEGDAWHAMVRDMWHWAEGRGFPTGVSKSPRHGDKPSPFVRFIWELQQRALPSRVTRYMPYSDFADSYPSLAKEIWKACFQRAYREDTD